MNKASPRNWNAGWISEFGTVCCGRIVRVDAERRPWVDFAGNPGPPVLARCLDTAQTEGSASLGDLPVLLVFEHGDPGQPIILGVVESALPSPGTVPASSPAEKPRTTALVDGRRVVLRGDEEVTLICGKGSITLTRDGRITLRGAEIVSRAAGANKIRGASVSIN